MVENQETVEFYENQCSVCYVTFFQKKRGRLRRTCSAACRQKLYLMRHPERVYQKKGDRGRGAADVGIVSSTAARMKKKGSVCPMCEKKIEQPKTGRKRKTCSDACRKRLWRQQNPRCLVCGKRFKMAKHQRVQYYCSKICKSRAGDMKKRHKRRMRGIAEMASYRPDWIPRPGSGYREEAIPVEDGEVEIVREREPKPNHKPPEWMRTSAGWLAHEVEERARHEAEQMAELEEDKAALKAKRAAAEKKEREDRSLHHFLFDTDW